MNLIQLNSNQILYQYHLMSKQLISINNNINQLNSKESKIQILAHELHTTKSSVYLYKARVEDSQETIKRLQSENKESKEKVKESEERIKNLCYKLEFTKDLLKHKEKEIELAKTDKETCDQLKILKPNLEQKIDSLSNKITTYKLDIQ